MAATRSDKDMQIARQGRIAAIVVAVTMILWLAVQWIGPQIGLAGRYALLADFAALAAFIWVFVVAAQIWRARRDEE